MIFLKLEVNRFILVKKEKLRVSYKTPELRNSFL